MPRCMWVPRLIHVCVPSTQSPKNKFQLLDMRNTHCVLVLEKSVKSLAQKSPVGGRQISSSQRVWTATVWSRELNTLEHFQGKLWCYQYTLVCSSHLRRNSSGKGRRPWEQAFVSVSGKWEKGLFPFLCRCSGMQLITVLSGLEQAVLHSPRVWNKGRYSYPHPSTPSFFLKNCWNHKHAVHSNLGRFPVTHGGVRCL